MTSDDVNESGLSRRALLRAGAWSAPIVVLATAAPAAAAGSLPARIAAVVYPERVNAASYSPGTISINDIDIRYDYGRWQLADEASGPATATATFAIAILDGDGNVLAEDTGTTDPIPKYSAKRGNGTFQGMPAGTFQLRVTVLSVVFSAATGPYDFQAEVPQVSFSDLFVVA